MKAITLVTPLLLATPVLTPSASLAGSSSGLTAEQQAALGEARKAFKELAQIVKGKTACEETTARQLALMTDEPAETVAKAAMAACYAHQQKLETWRSKYGLSMSVEQEYARDQANDAAAIKFLVLDVIKERLRRQTTPQPKAQARETPL
jgi:hypothetical protein